MLLTHCMGDGVQHVVQDKNGFESAESDIDQPITIQINWGMIVM